MEKNFSNMILKIHDIHLPDAITKIIISFDLERSFDIWFKKKITKPEFVLNITFTSFYDDILKQFQSDFYKHCKGSIEIFKHNSKKKLEIKIKDTIFDFRMMQ